MGKKGRGKKGKARKNNETSKAEEPQELKRAAHSFVVSRGKTGKYVSQLVLNFRRVMEPFTASQLRTKGTSVKDLASVAGPLGVTHLCLFTRTEVATYLKLAKLPRGPTLTFRVQQYALTRDVLSSLRRRVTYSRQFLHGPLLVLNNFSAGGREMQLAATMLQNMFPVLNIHKLRLNSLRRAVLFSYNADDGTIDFRHYTIKVVPVGISRGVKRLVSKNKVPNMGRMEDITDFVMKAGYGSESEGEDDPTSHVQLAQQVRSRGNMAGAQSAVRLVELGPRLTLQLTKAESGLMNGEVLYHRLVTKTEEELEEQQSRREQREQLRQNRRDQQTRNVEQKAAKKEELKQKSLAGMKAALAAAAAPPASESSSDDDGAPEAEEEGATSDGDDDAAWYRREVGQEPDQEFHQVAAASSSTAAAPAAARRFTRKRRAPDGGGGPKRQRQDGDANSQPSESKPPRNRRGKPVSGAKVRRRAPPASGGSRGRGRGGKR